MHFEREMVNFFFKNGKAKLLNISFSVMIKIILKNKTTKSFLCLCSQKKTTKIIKIRKGANHFPHPILISTSNLINFLFHNNSKFPLLTNLTNIIKIVCTWFNTYNLINISPHLSIFQNNCVITINSNFEILCLKLYEFI